MIIKSFWEKMKKKRLLITCLITLFLVTAFSITLVGCAEKSKETPSVESQYELGPRLIPENEMPGYFLVQGKLPEFKSKTEEREWLEKLTALGDRLDGGDVPFWDTLVVAHGTGADGYYWVGIEPGRLRELNPAKISIIVETINGAAKEIGFRKRVPVKFALEGESGIDKARNEEWRPVIGGIQVQNVDQGYIFTSTLGWAAKKGSSNGYVVAGHLGYNRLTQVGTMIYQPTYSSYPTDVVEDVGGTCADVAWVKFSNVAPKIYISEESQYSVNAYSNPYVGGTVFMSGITSGVQRGTVKYVNMDVPWPFGTLQDQALADYARAGGDSGAPVYAATYYSREMKGIHSGWNEIGGAVYARFSPVSGVETDVGAVPLTTYP
jgi:hypothetical protein